MTETILTEKPHIAIFVAYREEDFYEPVPPLVDPITEDPYDVTDVTFEMFIRRMYDKELIKKLTSTASAGILKEDAPAGLIALYLPRATVDAELPLGLWDQFMTLSFTDGWLGPVVKTFWRGTFLVLPGRVDTDMVIYEPMFVDPSLPRRLTLEARQTEDFERRFQMLEEGLPFDLTGWTLGFAVRPNYTHGTSLLSVGVTIADATLGRLRVNSSQASVAAATSSSRAAGGAWTYQFYGTGPTGERREFSRGPFAIVEGKRL